MRRNIHLTCLTTQGQRVRKIQISPCSEAKVTCSRARQKETNRKLLKLSTKMKPFLKQENLATPTQLRFKELCGGFYPYTSVSEQETSRKSRWGDVQLQQQNDGQEVLVWLAERGTKTRHGQERGHQRVFQRKFNQRFLPPIPQSPASGNEGTRITGIIDDQMKKFGIRRHPTEKMK